MANNNQRLTNLEGNVQELQVQLQTSVEALKKNFDEKLEQMLKGFEAMLSAQQQKRHDSVSAGISPSSSTLTHTESILGQYDGSNQSQSTSEGIFRTIKFEFPKFHGTNPRSWIRKCNKLFSHHAVAENQKLYLATMHLEGEAENWYSSFVESGVELTWAGLVDEILARFSPEVKVNPIAELKRLQQTGTVDEYRVKFEELRGWALIKNSKLNEEFFIDCFVGGLREEIQLGIQEAGVTTLKEAIRLARVEEAKIEAWIKRSRTVLRSQSVVNTVSEPSGASIGI